MNSKTTNRSPLNQANSNAKIKYIIKVYDKPWKAGRIPCLAGKRKINPKKMLGSLLGFCEEELEFRRFAEISIKAKYLSDSNNSVWVVVKGGGKRYTVHAEQIIPDDQCM